MNFEKFLKNTKSSVVLVYLLNGKKNNSTTIVFNTKINHPYMCTIINNLDKDGLIILKKDGRDKYIELTAKGKKIALKLFELKNILNE